MVIWRGRTFQLAVILFAATGSLISARCQTTEPAAVEAGSAVVNGNIYKPHLSRVKQTTFKDGKEQSSTSFTNDLVFTKIDGKAAIHIITKGEGWDLDIVMLRRSLALKSYEMKFSNGGFMLVKMEGPRVTGKVKQSDKTAERQFDEDLSALAVPAGIADTILGVLPLKLGYAVKIPVFQPAQPKVEWKTYRVTGREQINVAGKMTKAWVIEEEGRVKGTIWMIDKPPYMVKWIFRYPSGAELRLEQELVQVH